MGMYDFTFKTRTGEERSMADYKGKVLLIVNTATGCGFTPQYEDLQKIYDADHDTGLEILDFPCNQFAFQAPGSAEKIDSFCTLKYNTKFPRFEKIKVTGKDAAPLYKYLKEQKPGRIEWNFAKFLIDREGNVIERFPSTQKPDTLEKRIEEAL